MSRSNIYITKNSNRGWSRSRSNIRRSNISNRIKSSSRSRSRSNIIRSNISRRERIKNRKHKSYRIKSTSRTNFSSKTRSRISSNICLNNISV